MADPVASIPLGIRVPEPGGANMGTIGQFAQVQNWLNTSRLFQQTFAARMKAGELLATSDPTDPEAGIRALMQDPQTAAFAPEIINAIRAGQNTLVDMQGKQQQQAQSGFQAFLKSLPAAMADPTMLPGLIQANLAQLPKGSTVSPNVRESMRDVVTSLMDGLPADKDAAARMFRSRLGGLTMSAGITPETIKTLVGPISQVDLGGSKAFVQEPSPLMGGSPQVMGQLPMSVAPKIEFPPGMGPGGATVPLAVGPGGVGIAPTQTGPSTPGAIGGTPSPQPGLTPGGALSPTGTSPLSIAGPTMSQQEYFHKRTADMADYEKNLDLSVNNGSQLYRNMSEIMSAAQKAHIGGGAEAFKNLGTALQALGINNSIVDSWANGSLASSQVIDKVALTNAMTQLRQQLESSGSRINRQEFAAFLTKNPNLTTDPRAMIEIFNLWNSFYQRDKAEQTALNTAKKSPDFDIGSWPQKWQNSNYMQKYAPGTEFTGQGIPGAMPEKTPDGIFAPKTPEEVKSIPDGMHYRRPGDPPDKVRIKGG